MMMIFMRSHMNRVYHISIMSLGTYHHHHHHRPGGNTSQSPRLCWGRRPALKAPPKAPFRKFWLICPLKSLEMLEKGSKIFAPSARFVGVVVKPGRMDTWAIASLSGMIGWTRWLMLSILVGKRSMTVRNARRRYSAEGALLLRDACRIAQPRP